MIHFIKIKFIKAFIFLHILFSNNIYALDLDGISFTDQQKEDIDKSNSESPKRAHINPIHKNKSEEIVREKPIDKTNKPTSKEHKTSRLTEKRDKLLIKKEENDDIYMPNLRETYENFENSKEHVCQR